MKKSALIGKLSRRTRRGVCAEREKQKKTKDREKTEKEREKQKKKEKNRKRQKKGLLEGQLAKNERKDWKNSMEIKENSIKSKEKIGRTA